VVNGTALTVAPDLNAEHPVERAEVCDFYMLAQTVLKVVHRPDGAGGNCAVVMYGNSGEFAFVLVSLVEDGLVDRALGLPERKECGPELLIPTPAGLLEITQGLPQSQFAKRVCLYQTPCNQRGAASTKLRKDSQHEPSFQQ
jgi:hypothetical protein